MLDYITDPENFFGKSAEYMMSVMMQNSRDAWLTGEDEKSDDHWRLLVFEDSGELLTADAKQQVGQALSRLLNTVDGLIGQGLRIIVLVTTNEEIRKLHPAVSRPGRCSSRIEFKPFSNAEAVKWLALQNYTGPTSVNGGKTVAELYSILNGVTIGNEKKVGFS